MNDHFGKDPTKYSQISAQTAQFVDHYSVPLPNVLRRYERRLVTYVVLSGVRYFPAIKQHSSGKHLCVCRHCNYLFVLCTVPDTHTHAHSHTRWVPGSRRVLVRWLPVGSQHWGP